MEIGWTKENDLFVYLQACIEFWVGLAEVAGVGVGWGRDTPQNYYFF